MIVNPLVVAAAVAARAFAPHTAPRAPVPPPEPPSDAFADEYLEDTEVVMADDDVMYGHQARELEDFLGSAHDSVPPPMESAPLYDPPVDVKDAEIVSEERSSPKEHKNSSTATTSSTKPPPLPDTNNPHTLLGIGPDATFDDARRAYKHLVKLYHPDAAVGPDASPEERQSANWDFARINEAFDILKRRENEEVFEYTVYEDGEGVTRSVVMSDESRRRDPYRIIDYDQIRYGPRERMWYEEEHDYQPRHNGFNVDSSSYSTSYDRGRWWSQHNFNYEPIRSDQRRWEERGREGTSVGFGAAPRQDSWWNENPSFQESQRQHEEYPPRTSRSFPTEEWEGYPYKDRVWNERLGSDDYGPGRTISGTATGYDYDPEAYFPGTEKWWKAEDGDDSWGNFAP